MPRRFRDEPINLINRIPSPEQISAARPLKGSLGRALVATGVGCIPGVAEIIAQVRRLGRIPRTAVSGGAVSSDSSLRRTKEWVGTCIRTLASRSSRSYDRLAEWIANLVVTVQPVRPVSSPPSEMPSEAPPVVAAIAPSIQHDELVELRTYTLSQQEDIFRLSAELQELKSLVMSQQQVLVYLGKELESTQTQVPTITASASAPAKRNRVVRDKPIVKEKWIPRKGTQKSSLNLLLGLASLFLIESGCLSTGAREEALGFGIVRGTLGVVHPEGETRIAHPRGVESLKGYVVTLEGGAYVLHALDGAEYRIPLDENTRIDRPAHLGDRIEAFLD